MTISAIGLAFGVVVAVATFQFAAAQTVHTVGGDIGWKVPQGGAQVYANWASDKTFKVGDILAFNFATNEHDVLQVTKESFDACTSTNPIGSTIQNGPANITLTSNGEHYYICTVGRHCQGGQKLEIRVSGTPIASPPTTTPTTPSPTSNNPDDCAPAPSTDPSAKGPSGGSNTDPSAPTPPPVSSSSKVLASVLLPIMAIAMSFVF